MAVLTSPDGLVSVTITLQQDNIAVVGVYVLQISAVALQPPMTVVRLALEKKGGRVWEGHSRLDASV